MQGIATIADIEAIEASTPHLPAQSTYEVIAAAARRHGDAPALSFFLTAKDHRRPEVLSYRGLLEGITATANLFQELGIGAQDVVAFVLPNLPETHFTIWGGEAAGIAFAINPLLEPAAIADLLVAGEAKVLVTLAPFPGVDLWARLHPVLQRVPTLRHVVLVNLADHVRGPKGWIARLLQMREERRLHGRSGVAGALGSGVQVHDFRRATRRQRSDRLVSARVARAEDLSSYFCTGGTTGQPKIAMRTHGNEVANAWSASQFIGDGIGPGTVVFCGLPLFHVNAVAVTGLMPFSRGAHVLLGTPQGYRGEGVIGRFWEIVEHHRINFFSGVPTLFSTLLAQPSDGRDLASLRYALCGAAPMPVEVMRTFQELTGIKILEGYGLTEGTCVSSSNPPLGERRIGSIGLRIPGQDMRVVRLDETGAFQGECAVGEVGVLAISGPNVFRGYKVDAHNKGLWLDLGDGRRWLNTGDLGRQDDQGYFYLTGRKKELIIRGGHNLDPASIEEPLHGHPAVQLVAAVPRPDRHAGELPIVYVQLKPGASASETELLDYARQRIPERAAWPKAVRIVQSMPLTGVGKIFKPALKRQEIESALRDALDETGLHACDFTVVDDPKIGTCVDLQPGQDSEPAAAARRVLGAFPFVVRQRSD